MGDGEVGELPMYGKKVMLLTFQPPGSVIVKSSATRKPPASEWLKPRLVRPTVTSREALVRTARTGAGAVDQRPLS